MKKNTILFLSVAGFVVFLILGIWLLDSRFGGGADNQPATPITSDIILFYGNECPHCLELEKWIADNDIAEKVKFDSLEVWHNNKNRDVLVSKAAECNLQQEEIGVPLLYAEEKCFVGAPLIEEFLKKKAGM